MKISSLFVKGDPIEVLLKLFQLLLSLRRMIFTRPLELFNEVVES